MGPQPPQVMVHQALAQQQGMVMPQAQAQQQRGGNQPAQQQQQQQANKRRPQRGLEDNIRRTIYVSYIDLQVRKCRSRAPASVSWQNKPHPMI